VEAPPPGLLGRRCLRRGHRPAPDPWRASRPSGRATRGWPPAGRWPPPPPAARWPSGDRRRHYPLPAALAAGVAASAGAAVLQRQHPW